MSFVNNLTALAVNCFKSKVIGESIAYTHDDTHDSFPQVYKSNNLR